jgi:hypothetical protein
MNSLITVGAGLIGVFIVLALIVSQIVEWLSAVMSQRGKFLQRGIEALFDWQSAPAGLEAKALTKQLYDHPLISNLGTGERPPSYIPSRTFTLSLISVLRGVSATATPPPPLPSTVEQLQQDLMTRINGLPADSPLRKNLSVVLEDSLKTYEDTLDAIDGWFDTQMDRVSGYYKRWSWLWQAVIALLIVVIANADTISITGGLLRNATLAQAAAQAAQGLGPNTDPGTLITNYTQAMGQLFGWPSPFGWSDITLAKIAGLLLTWFAVLLGAPFWFDILKRIVPVRLSGTKPAPSDAAAAGDAQAVSTDS